MLVCHRSLVGGSLFAFAVELFSDCSTLGRSLCKLFIAVGSAGCYDEDVISQWLPMVDRRIAFFSISVVLVRLCVVADSAAGASSAWSLSPLVSPRLPEAVSTESNAPIDQFVSQRLTSAGLSFSPPAKKSIWLRRVYFDLIGLPPSPEALDDFIADSSPLAFERVVDRLLGSPRYGERWARHWMDAVRYAETHGHDEDGIRENAWPYRDWLIQALNRDLPYRDFVKLQIAGDVIAPEDPWAVAATGFLSCGPWDQSSQMGIQDGTLDKKIAQYLDRDDMLSVTMSTFTSTTVHCARCHDHKFDPIPLEDYYALQSVFAGVDKVDRPFELDTEVIQERARLEAEKQALVEGRLPTLLASLQEDIVDWAREIRSLSVPWTFLQPRNLESINGSSFEILEDQSILSQGELPDTDTYTVRAIVAPGTLTALRLEVLADSSLPFSGPGRSENGNFHLSDIEVRIDGKVIAIDRAVADFEQSGWGIKRAIDDDEDSAWGVHPQEGQSHRAVFHFKDGVTLGAAAPIAVTLSQGHGRGHVIGRFRLAVTDHASPAEDIDVSNEIYAKAALVDSQRTEEGLRVLALAYLKEANEEALEALPSPRMVYAVSDRFDAKGNFKPSIKPREVHVLQRGNIRSPIALAEPGALSCVSQIESRFGLVASDLEGPRRVALANWLVHADNVLAWRSIVNRIWYHHFGRGIVASLNDFGKMGDQPSHPELLDHLAVGFRDQGGRLKWLHRHIVLSRTYRQSSADQEAGLAIDPENQLLWRMNARQLDAECVRDSVVQLSGKLDHRMGGPSSRQFKTSKGVHVTPVVDYDTFDPDAPENLRRAVYRFVFRTVPDPLMQSLGCPDASQLTARRETSATALQALALLNNRFVVRQSEHIAESLARIPSLDGRVPELFRRAYSRSPTEQERQSVSRYARQHGFANACRVILNSSEFLYCQ